MLILYEEITESDWVSNLHDQNFIEAMQTVAQNKESLQWASKEIKNNKELKLELINILEAIIMDTR